MKKVFDNYIKVTSLSSLVFLLFGILLLVNPEGIIVLISSIFGVIGIAFGIFLLIYYTKTVNHPTLIIGLFSLIAGIVLILNTKIFATVVPIIIGVAIIIQSVQKIEIAAAFKEQKVNDWSYLFASATIMLIFGIIFVVHPVTGAILTTQVIGILIMAYSIMSIVNNIIFRKKFKEINKIIDEIKE